MREPKCLKLAKKIVRLVRKSGEVDYHDQKRAFVIAKELWEAEMDEAETAKWAEKLAEISAARESAQPE